MSPGARLRVFAAKLKARFVQDKENREFDEELWAHLQLLTEQYLRQGMPAEEASLAARRQFGNSSLIRERHREARRFLSLSAFWRDVRFGARQLARNPLFTAIAVSSLALGIGANTAIFSAAKRVLLDTLPVTNPHDLRLLTWVSGHQQPVPQVWGDVWSTGGGGLASNAFSYLVFQEMRKKTDAVRGLIAFKDVKMTANVDRHPELVSGELVSGGAFDVLGVKPILGRLLNSADDAGPGKGPVAMISEGYWAARFGRSQAVLGDSLVLNGVGLTIVGVLPAQFTGLQMGSVAQVFVPITMQPVVAPRAQLLPGDTSLLNNPQAWWIHILVRLQPHVSEARTQSALNLSLRQTAMDTLPKAKDLDQLGLQLVQGDRGVDDLRGQFADPSYLLLGLAGLVLLLACVNLANLLLARGAGRQREMSTRLALGAGKAQILRQVLTESLLLASFGGMAGLGLGFLLRNAIPGLLGNSSSDSWSGPAIRVVFDWQVLAFAAAISLAAGLLFGMIPAWQAMHINVNRSLKGTGNTTAGRNTRWLGKGLVITQIALSMVLLIGAGLFVRTLVNLSRTTLGFRSDRLLLFELDPPRTRYSGTQMTMLYRQLEEKIAAIPGVRSVSLSNIAIIGDGYSGTTFHLPERSAQSNQERVQINSVGTDFFRTMGIPLLQGRAFAEHDTSSAPTVAVVNQALARRFFPRENPIGQIFEADSEDANGPIQIIGVVADTRYADLRAETPPIFYIPYQQQPNAGHMVVEVHTAAEPGAVLSQVRASVEGLDRELPMIDVRTMTDQLTASLSAERVFANLTAGFGLLALVLAAIGIYGIMTYTVSRRNQEIGLRMALGEQPASVVWMVLREALGMLAIGLVAGIGCSLALSRFVAAQLFGLRAVDTSTYVAAIALLSVVAVVSSFMPARRASAIDPLTTLRYE
jgi:predicted permease